MKAKQYIIYLMLLPALVLAGSCSRELNPDTTDPVLMISPSVLGGQDLVLHTRAAHEWTEDELKDTDYNENVINRLDVFFFQGNDLKKDYHLPKDALVPTTHSGLTGYLLSNDWTKDNLKKDTQYTIYVIANATSAAITTGEGITSPALLEAVKREEPEIYKRQLNSAAAGDNTYTPSKSFLMNKQVTWAINSYATQLVNGERINLMRSAVKFVVDLSLDSDFKDRLATSGMQYGKPSWKYSNFNDLTYEVPATPAQTPALKNLIESVSGGFLASDGPDKDGNYQIVTYAYPQSWSDNPDEAPGLLVSYEATKNGVASWHYYYIPLCYGVNKTESNRIYKVKAIISSLGSTEAVSNSQVNLTYEVLDWVQDGNESNVDAKQEDFLMAVPSTYVFKGGDPQTALTTAIKVYASGAVTMSDLKGSYKDKNGDLQEVTIEDGVFNAAVADDNSKVDVSSWVPTNGTFREYQFTLTCGTKSQVVKIRHYPLDFITSESGSYSTYNDEEWAYPGHSGKYVSSVSNEGIFYFVEGRGGSFNALEYYNRQFWNLGLNGNREDQNQLGGLDNNRIYVLQITSSNDKYTIGRPVVREVETTISRATRRDYYPSTIIRTGIKYKTSQDNVLSPAFMLASQLGANDGFPSSESAAIHCSLYKEVVNGKTYTEWRLPTKQEVQFMIDNQNTYEDVMDEVLGGRYYWALDGTKAEYTEGSYPQNTYTRCVRDLSAKELEEINKFE